MKNKDREYFQLQEAKAFKAFLGEPKTMLMVAVATGIERANICRYVARWRKRGQVTVDHYGLCQVTKYRAGYLSTNTSEGWNR
jgi:DNA-binding transcriptional regulator LsrR (DeoR family)